MTTPPSRALLLLPLLLVATPVLAQTGLPQDSTASFGGYVETHYSRNLAGPPVHALRGFDGRAQTFTVDNAVISGAWQRGPVTGLLALQVGSTPASYYAAEPVLAAGSGVPASGPELWQHLQQALVGWHSRVVTVQAGLFLSPIGPENVAVHEHWNWSRSNLFVALPFYHTGVRTTWQATTALALTAGLTNGWNSVVDGNHHKSLLLQASWERAPLAATVLYFGGVERPTGDPRGEPWRHLLDAYARWDVTARLAVQIHLDAGQETATRRWLAAALYARVELLQRLWLALRADVFRDGSFTSGAAPLGSGLFWPTRTLGSGTATLEVRPAPQLSVRLEYRHDAADDPVFPRESGPSPRQDTALLGATAWF